MVPSSITFNWRKCKDRPWGIKVHGQPVALRFNGKLYIGGFKINQYYTGGTGTVLEYSQVHDRWTKLPPLSGENFTLATLRGQLLAVGGESDYKMTNTIFRFDEHSRQWIRYHPAMPTALTAAAVIEYQDHLIVAGGGIPDVNILDTISNKWKTAQPLPSTGNYYAALIEDTMYLVGRDTPTVLRAHVPTLISGAESGVWETLPNTPYRCSSPVAFNNTLLTVGGSRDGKPTTSIQMYDPTTNQWTRVGDLPQPMSSPCSIITSSELFVVGTRRNHCLFVSNLIN